MPVGWTTPTFNAGTFTANGAMTWTVGSTDVVTFAYRYLDAQTMQLIFDLRNTSVGGTPNTSLRITVPEGKSVAWTAQKAMHASNNGTRVTGYINLSTGGPTVIGLRKIDDSNWSATSTDNTDVAGSIIFEIA